jgi:hypothetical protein
MNLRRVFWLAMLVGLGFHGKVTAQYNLEELGFELGPGFIFMQNSEENALGPGGNANVFFSHYACGKGYGFHLSGGAAALFPGTANGSALLDLPAAQRTGLSFMALDFAVLGKLRIHEYHRPREWAVYLGPRLMLPLMARYSSTDGSGALGDVANNVSRFWPGVQLSMQFRRPVGNKKSLFIHPGVTYFFMPAFDSNVAGAVKPIYFFLNLGYAFWDMRG